MPEPVEVRKIPIMHVSDASGLAELIDSGVLAADRKDTRSDDSDVHWHRQIRACVGGLG